MSAGEQPVTRTIGMTCPCRLFGKCRNADLYPAAGTTPEVRFIDIARRGSLAIEVP
jgi:hypothetical protein